MSATRRGLVAGSAAVLVALGGGAASGALALPGMGALQRPAAGSEMGWGSGMPGTGASADQMFAVHMPAHHESAVQMARLAEERAQRPDVRALAGDIERTQTAEIEQLRAAAARLTSEAGAGGAGPTGMGTGMGTGMRMGMGIGVDLDQVPAGEGFDRAFLQAMIPHHEMGVQMAEMVQRRDSDPQIQALAAEMVRVQTSEIALMQRWLDQQ